MKIEFGLGDIIIIKDGKTSKKYLVQMIGQGWLDITPFNKKYKRLTIKIENK